VSRDGKPDPRDAVVAAASAYRALVTGDRVHVGHAAVVAHVQRVEAARAELWAALDRAASTRRGE
jgi:hypothetical protein